MNIVKFIYIINKLNDMPKPIKAALLLLALLAGHQRSSAQNSSVLDGYLHLGLDSNLALHQRDFDLSQSQLDLKRAQSLFYPAAAFSSQYTVASGGRTQAIPIGDLLNSVYSTLNKLTGSSRFPQVDNQSIQFLPNDFHDTKMEITLPILNIDLQHNRTVTRETVGARRADRDIYRRDLVHSIRQAYYQYLQAGKAVEIYAASLLLVKENRRVSEKFVENQMATRESVIRAQAQVSRVEASLIEAQNDRRNAAAYFNFLLNRPLDSPVVTDSTLMTAPAPVANSGSSADREEFSRLKTYQHIVRSNLRYDRNYLVPRLSAFYDVGYQGFGFHFNGTQFYQLAGVNLTWSLFKAGDNRYKIQQARIDIDALDDQYRELAQQLTLQQQTTLDNYRSALDALDALADEAESAREAYRLVAKRFAEGQALQIEVIDARNQFTDAEIRYSLGRLRVLDRAADLERATAAYELRDASRPRDNH
jgi:outer membrane protein